jgi:hypothetical protein
MSLIGGLPVNDSLLGRIGVRLAARAQAQRLSRRPTCQGPQKCARSRCRDRGVGPGGHWLGRSGLARRREVVRELGRLKIGPNTGLFSFFLFYVFYFPNSFQVYLNFSNLFKMHNTQSNMNEKFKFLFFIIYVLTYTNNCS